MPDAPPPDAAIFPADNRAGSERAARELERRLELMPEVCRIIAERALHHAAKAQAHQGYWLHDWQVEKSQRLHELARILGSPDWPASSEAHQRCAGCSSRKSRRRCRSARPASGTPGKSRSIQSDLVMGARRPDGRSGEAVAG